ncbi:hypothetical protein SKAU_G00154430 [Synaphobranchus kaupii]|uniref:Uncharacterized protein n=1 Tax=Synaphobranchus kaupii TaxID=118154 RepID=A0A9Q1FHF8_SYNKA|nr:hypothetical protein SKAU_G00154430 [Synaphobranchus kaupii]
MPITRHIVTCDKCHIHTQTLYYISQLGPEVQKCSGCLAGLWSFRTKRDKTHTHTHTHTPKTGTRKGGKDKWMEECKTNEVVNFQSVRPGGGLAWKCVFAQDTVVLMGLSHDVLFNNQWGGKTRTHNAEQNSLQCKKIQTIYIDIYICVYINMYIYKYYIFL